MTFNPENRIVQLCADGMTLEGKGDKRGASQLFLQAWLRSATDFEKFTAAHYVARHQKNISDKLKWDKTALKHALNINDESTKETLPSLYLNIGKCYEDLNDLDNAKSNYQAAFSYAVFLPDNGYGNMIRTGIEKGLERTTNR